jgi:hypothetical protein
VSRVLADAEVESYAGYRGDETPRAVVLGGKRFEVANVLWRKRIVDSASGLRRDVWRCLLDDGRAVTIELPELGPWRVFL